MMREITKRVAKLKQERDAHGPIEAFNFKLKFKPRHKPQERKKQAFTSFSHLKHYPLSAA